MIITAELLRSKNACKAQVALFEQRFPEGMPVTEDICLSVATLFSARWAALNLLPATARDAYFAAVKPALDAYNAIEAAALDAYSAAALDAYFTGVGPTWDTFVAAVRPAQDAFAAAKAVAFARAALSE